MQELAQVHQPEASIEPRPAGAELATKRAVIYLRVSTAKQADKDADAEGYSLPAQREACLRKAEALGAQVVEEYLDRGESAKTTDRPEFQRMLTRIRLARDVDYVILDKIDRFARNRRDDANTMFELKSHGAQLVSVKENIDETPAGQLLHAIMAGIAEFYSRNLATEALKGMTQKAKTGGTPRQGAHRVPQHQTTHRWTRGSHRGRRSRQGAAHPMGLRGLCNRRLHHPHAGRGAVSPRRRIRPG
jgi:DNA invertase Pin-like site-specific DNA recombinase